MTYFTVTPKQRNKNWNTEIFPSFISFQLGCKSWSHCSLLLSSFLSVSAEQMKVDQAPESSAETNTGASRRQTPHSSWQTWEAAQTACSHAFCIPLITSTANTMYHTMSRTHTHFLSTFVYPGNVISSSCFTSVFPLFQTSKSPDASVQLLRSLT